MDSTKEKLVKAARICNLEIKYWLEGTPVVVPREQSSGSATARRITQPFSWNPKECNADSFSMAVQLGISLDTKELGIGTLEQRSRAARQALLDKAVEMYLKHNLDGAKAK